MTNFVGVIDESDDFMVVDVSKVDPSEMPQLEDYCRQNDVLLTNEDMEELIFVTVPNVEHRVLRRKTTKKPKVTKKLLKEAISKCQDPTLTNIGKALGVGYDTVRKYVNRWDLQPLIDQQRQQSVDVVESALYKAATSGDMKAIKLFLENYGKNRGYGQVEDKPAKLDLNIQIVDTPPDKEG